MAIKHYWDIESLENVFSLTIYEPEKPLLHVFYLIDDGIQSLDGFTPLSNDGIREAIAHNIFDQNKIFAKESDRNLNSIRFYNLQTAENIKILAKFIGFTPIGNVSNINTIPKIFRDFRPVCDTDINYRKDEDAYLCGYNSSNYDTTMISLFLYEAFYDDIISNDHIKTKDEEKEEEEDLITNPVAPTAKTMRVHNDRLFSKKFKDMMPRYLQHELDEKTSTYKYTGYKDPRSRIRSNMLRSGRHVDISSLNEKAVKIGLKKLLAMLGYQIKESDKLAKKTKINTFDEFLDLLAYNASDVIYLRKLADHKVYKSNFDLKHALLFEYPDIVYEKKENEYAPDIRPEKVRFDRLYVDSTSANFAEKTLCPYGHLDDCETISYMYPSEKVSKKLGIPRVNVLDELKNFMYENFPQEDVRAKFDEIYNYYKSIEGMNINDSIEYAEKYGKYIPELDCYELPDKLKPRKISDISVPNTNFFYHDANGKPTSCFVNFSIGGIHGQEFNKVLYDKVNESIDKEIDLLTGIQIQYEDATEFNKLRKIEIEGELVETKKFLTSKSTLKHADWKPLPKRKEAFRLNKNGVMSLEKIFNYASAGIMNHEDFKSYYPNLLRMLNAFWNEGLGYDRYGKFYELKEEYGKEAKRLKKLGLDATEILLKQLGVKLVLNSATGAADTETRYKEDGTPTKSKAIRMNNMITSMRIIGQLFSFRIGQAQTLKGALVPSTNTDGLYTVYDKDLNNKILEEEGKKIHIQIDPEELFLISKDTNNRCEFSSGDYETAELISAAGGQMGAYHGFNPQSQTDHPPVIDFMLVKYLKYQTMVRGDTKINLPFDESIAKYTMHLAAKHFKDARDFLCALQIILSSSVSSMRYVVTRSNSGAIGTLQHYNRAFPLRYETPETKHVENVVAKKITPAMKKKRMANNERIVQHDPTALSILREYGIEKEEIPSDSEAVFQKISKVDPSWNMLIKNEDIHELSEEEARELISKIDFDVYFKELEKVYEGSWRNLTEPKPKKTTKKLAKLEETIELDEEYDIDEEE